MQSRTVYFILMILAFSMFAVIPNVNAHSLFNSAEQIIGGYRVQIATLPEFPNIGEKSQLLFRVQDEDFNEIDRFTMGVRIFYNDILVDELKPQSNDEGHWETDYVFERPGNHIFKVDLYDVGKDGGVITYIFNIGTQTPFGYVFFASIALGSTILAIVVGYIYIPKKLKKLRSKF